MKKLFIIFLVLIGFIGLISCASGHRQGDILYPAPTSDIPAGPQSAAGRPSSTGRISIEEFNEKEILFKNYENIQERERFKRHISCCPPYLILRHLHEPEG